ncbi:hypothetical protein OIU76_016269 [Salix suchowensis]|nr:hypothetical protein OIU76_016269 [Salix suchowensis]
MSLKVQAAMATYHFHVIIHVLMFILHLHNPQRKTTIETGGLISISSKKVQVKDKTMKERKIALKIFTDVVEEFREEALNLQ